MSLRRRLGVPAIVLAGLMCVLGGCDLVGEEEPPKLLLGAWQTENLSVDGVSVKAQLNAQYDRSVLTLREGAEGGEFFTMVGRTDGAEEDLFVQGTFEVDSDEELTLFPDKRPQVEFDYAVPDSSRPDLRLSAEEGASEDRFLKLIRLPIQGAVDRVEMHLSKGDSGPATVGAVSPADPR